MTSNRSGSRPCPLDRAACRRRNVIERMFGRLKNWRRIATRHGGLATSSLSALALVAGVSERL